MAKNLDERVAEFRHRFMKLSYLNRFRVLHAMTAAELVGAAVEKFISCNEEQREALEWEVNHAIKFAAPIYKAAS